MRLKPSALIVSLLMLSSVLVFAASAPAVSAGPYCKVAIDSAPMEVSFGETVTVVWTVTNTGDETANIERGWSKYYDGYITYAINEDVPAQTLAAGASVTFTHSMTIRSDKPATDTGKVRARIYYDGTKYTKTLYDVKITGVMPPEIRIVDPTPKDITMHDTVTVTWEVENPNDVGIENLYSYVYYYTYQVRGATEFYVDQYWTYTVWFDIDANETKTLTVDVPIRGDLFPTVEARCRGYVRKKVDDVLVINEKSDPIADGFTEIEIGPKAGDVLKIAPSDDAEIRQQSPNYNYGTSNRLGVRTVGTGGDRAIRSFAKFDLSGVPDGAEIVHAHLEVDTYYVGAPEEGVSDVQIYSVTDDSWIEAPWWNPLAIRWNNQPPMVDLLDEWFVAYRYQWCYFDVEDFVAQQAAGDDTVSLAMKTKVEDYDGGYKNVYFNSKDYYLPYYRPYLEVAYVMPATVDIDPDTLNLKSKGKWITAYISELPDGLDVANVNIGSITLNCQVSVERAEVQGDVLMLKFDRQKVQDIVSPGDEVELTIAGDGFSGSDTIRVISPGNK